MAASMVILRALRLQQAQLNSSRELLSLPVKIEYAAHIRRSRTGLTRSYGTSTIRAAAANSVATATAPPPLSFPCLDAIDNRTAALQERRQNPRAAASTSGPSPSAFPEPSYTPGLHKTLHTNEPLLLDWGGVLPSFDIAYETWGTLNADRSNAILLHPGLSASSHAASTKANSRPGWWEQFIGPGRALDTDRFYVICTNVLGGCYGSTGPSSVLPGASIDGECATQPRYATRFPILTIQDMVRAQFRLLDGLGVERLYASIGGSMGGMQSLAAGVLFPERIGRVVSISGCARSHPYIIAMRHTQRQVLMNDPAWSSTRGDYYAGIPPHAGMKLAREIATITYRSAPEWEQRFGRRRVDTSKPPALCPDFLIETYLDHAGDKWCLEYDANSLLYVSKAMDLFDLGAEHMGALETMRKANAYKLKQYNKPGQTVGHDTSACSLSLPDKPYKESSTAQDAQSDAMSAQSGSAVRPSSPPEDLVHGLSPLKDMPTLVMGVTSDLLFPAWQQREIAETLRSTGNKHVKHVELGENHSLFGHDTFLLDPEGIGGEIQRFLSRT